ncbi:winged helix-turn-helix transcriptional regulator [Brevibacillus sp. H7]|uniref:winged helix-turn-helix transcriptional regulator n=1 Tax=Brevibacillus sp. H7 TaxID=3349138 RepID=UPI00380AD535
MQQDREPKVLNDMENLEDFCAIKSTLSIIDGKWTLWILRELLTGPKRFGELLRAFEGVSPKTLTLRLKQLEEEGIILRVLYPEIPPRVEYSLTEKGEQLRPIFNEMRNWGKAWLHHNKG